MAKHNVLYEPTVANCHAASVLLRDSYPKPYHEWLAFRMALLTAWEEHFGTLTCAYCGRQGLQKVTEGVPRSKQATLDHVVARANGGAEFDVNNLVVACTVCNSKKGDK